MKEVIPQSEPATRFADEAHTAGTCFSDGLMLPEMVVVPPGKFWMGADDESANTVEMRRHWVQIACPLGVSRYPVTFEQWDFFAEGDPEVHRPEDWGLGRGKRPVVNVSWEDAEHYVTWLSIAAGRTYRLLSEAEWEYCCRAGRPPAVGLFRPNAFGLFDMDGNVGELVADAWHESYQGAPANGSAWEPNKDTMWRVVRGGRRDGFPGIVSGLFRDSVHHLKRVDNIGFRVACGLD